MASEILSEPEQLRDAIAIALQNNADFQGVSVLTRKTANIANEIERNLDKTGALVVVILPSARSTRIQSQTVVLAQRIIFRCVTGIGNKTGKSAHYLATRTAAAMQLFKPALPFLSGALAPEDPLMREVNIIVKPSDDENEEFAAWDVFYTAQLSLAPRPGLT